MNQNGIMGILNSPQMQGIAQGLLAASGPTTGPAPSLGQALAGGMQRGQQLEQLQRQREMERLMLSLKLKEHERKAKKDNALQEYLTGGMGGGMEAGAGEDAALFNAGIMSGEIGPLEALNFRRETQDRLKKQGQENAQANLALKSTADNLTSNIQTIDRMLTNESGLQGATGFQGMFPTLSGSNTARFEEDLENINADAVIESVKQLKAEGGTLGQITERELPILMRSRTELGEARNPQDYKRALLEYRSSLQRIHQAMITGHEEAGRVVPGDIQRPKMLPEIASDPEAQRLGIDESVLLEYMKERGQ